jgi:hypothetical protein
MRLSIHIYRFFFTALLLIATAEYAISQTWQWRDITPVSGPQPEPRRYGSAIHDPVTLKYELRRSQWRIRHFGGTTANGNGTTRGLSTSKPASGLSAGLKTRLPPEVG